ncbi:MAG: AarF/UbiB family protein, partial [Salinisphaeraceae bacterium]|nr:AarF/UbiB family protein [Salinisphaeraceae bacterium]
LKVGRHNLDREFVIGKLVLNLAIMSSQYWAPHSKLAPFLQALQDQVDEFVKGFTRELDFEQEARNHRLFYERSMSSSMWHVPALYASSHRILEMEYLDDADSLVTALKTMPTYKRRRFQRKLSEHFLYTVLSHLLFYQEAHGDLHPGNIMINARGELHLIDWGNAVDMNGKWAAVWNYLVGAALGDRVLLTNALINMSRDPEADAKRWDEIHDLLGETLDRKNIHPVSATNFLWVLSKEGMEGLHQRAQTVLHLVANSQQLGIIVRSDYMHLSRSLFAAAGSFATLYEDSSKMLLFRDMAISLARMPWLFTKDKTKVRLAEIRDNWKRRIPVRVSLQTRVPDYRNYPQKLAEPGNKALDNALEKKIA